MKYENEINALLKSLIFEYWMSEEDVTFIIDETLKITGITKQSLSDKIETGVKNGYSVESQIKKIKDNLFK